jgi:hypothetical protein
MPNWCYTTLIVTGEQSDLQQFFDAIKDPEGGNPHEYKYKILQTLMPTPKQLTETMKGFTNDEEAMKELKEQQLRNMADFGYADWYDWNCAVWGTKWGDCDTELSVSLEQSNGTEIVFNLCSAWSPITEGIKHISETFTNLYFVMEHREEAGFYAGYEVVHNGVQVFESMFEDDKLDTPPYEDTPAWYDTFEEIKQNALQNCAVQCSMFLSTKGLSL